MLLPVVFISARHDHAARGQFGVVGDEHPAFARIDQLVGLERKAPDLANRANLAAMPRRAQRMGRVFHHRHASGIAKGQYRIHIRGVAPHMADQHSPCAGQFGREIIHINAVILTHFYQNRLTFGMHHG